MTAMTPTSDNNRMRQSKVLQKLRAGLPACSVKINVSGIRATEIVAMSGFDCIWTDMEHVPNDFGAIEGQILAAKLYDTDIIALCLLPPHPIALQCQPCAASAKPMWKARLGEFTLHE